MGRICEQCGRGAMKAYTRSHSKRASIRHRQINLQTKKVGAERMKICTNCIKTLAKAHAA